MTSWSIFGILMAYNPRLKYWTWVVESIQINSAEASHQISLKIQVLAVKGRIMLRVKDIMTTGLITVSPETEILQAAKVLLGNHINYDWRKLIRFRFYLVLDHVHVGGEYEC